MTQSAQAYAEAYKFGYALVDHYRIFYQDLTTDHEDGRHDLNQLSGEARAYGPDDRAILSPNNDTPYSRGYLDLRQGWCSLLIPDSEALEARYNSFQCVDMFTNNIGYISVVDDDLSSGNKAGNYLFYNTNNAPPEDVGAYDKVFAVNSDFVFLIGRTQMRTMNTDEATAVEKQTVQGIMDSFAVTAQLPSQGFPSDAVAADGLTIDDLSAAEFFNILAYTLQFQHPTPGGYEATYISETLSGLGIIPGQPFSGDPTAAEEGKAQALPVIVSGANTIGTSHEGWDMMDPSDRFFVVEDADGALFRSLVGKKGIYANNPNEAYYPVAGVDSAGNVLNGANVYHLEIGDPPVGGFWSLTMYRLSDGFLVENPIDRYSIGTDRVEIVDDTISVIIRAVSDGEDDISPNVLPAPLAENFYVVLRLYLPEADILDGDWQPPGIVKQVG